MKKILFTLLIAVLAACGKVNPEPVTTLLGEKTFSEEAGRFMYLFNENGVWGVSSSCDWIHVEERYYKGEAAFEVRIDSNESSVGDHRFCRVGKVYVRSWDGSRKDELVIRQDGLAPEISLEDVTIDGQAGSYAMPMENNLSDRERKCLAFTCDASWVSDLSFGMDGESVTFNATAGSGRSALIAVTFTDAWGRKFTSEAKVTQ